MRAEVLSARLLQLGMVPTSHQEAEIEWARSSVIRVLTLLVVLTLALPVTLATLLLKERPHALNAALAPTALTPPVLQKIVRAALSQTQPRALWPAPLAVPEQCSLM